MADVRFRPEPWTRGERRRAERAVAATRPDPLVGTGERWTNWTKRRRFRVKEGPCPDLATLEAESNAARARIASGVVET